MEISLGELNAKALENLVWISTKKQYQLLFSAFPADHGKLADCAKIQEFHFQGTSMDEKLSPNILDGRSQAKIYGVI